MSRIIGIDLGTTNSLVAYVDERTGLPRAIPDDAGRVLLPSVVAVTPDGDQYAVVRDWPAGTSVFQGPAGRRWGYRTRARAAWVGDEVWVSYDASLGPGKVGPVVFVFRGNPGNRMMRVDTYPHHPSMGEPVYAEPDSDTTAEPVPEP